MRRYVFLILTILWMTVIFLYSAKDAEESTEDSYTVGMTIGRIFIPHFAERSAAEQLAFAEKADHPVRKTAHAAEYAVLGFLTAGTIFGFSNVGSYPQKILVAWLIATFYAATDEVHQLFVPGRSGQISDVCLDSVGVLLGVAIFALLTNRKEKN